MNRYRIIILNFCFIYFFMSSYPSGAMDICSTHYPYNPVAQNYSDLPKIHVDVYNSHGEQLTNVLVGQGNYDLLKLTPPYFDTTFFRLKRDDIISIRDDTYRITGLFQAEREPPVPNPVPGHQISPDCLSVEKTSVNLLANQKNSIILAQDSALYVWNDFQEPKITQIFFDKIKGENISLIWQSELSKNFPLFEKHHINGQPFRGIMEHRVTLKIGEYFSIPEYGKLKIVSVIPGGVGHKIWIVMNYMGI